MTTAPTWFSSVPSLPISIINGNTRESALRSILRSFSGIESVRVLPASSRAPKSRDKVYVVLSLHDVRRDRRIVEVLCQLDDTDFDLVPIEAEGMIPDGAIRYALS